MQTNFSRIHEKNMKLGICIIESLSKFSRDMQSLYHLGHPEMSYVNQSRGAGGRCEDFKRSLRQIGDIEPYDFSQ